MKMPYRAAPSGERVHSERFSAAQAALDRRSFQLFALYFLGALIAVALSIPAAIYLLVPPRFRKPSGYIDAGDISQLTPGVPTELTFVESGVDGWRAVSQKKTAWVVPQPSGSVVAFGPQCTHLGCAYHFEDSQNEFVCPCHASVFGLDGHVVSGPAARPLDRYMTRVRNNRLQLGPLRSSTPSKG
jgi:menaquinol-cytochrome c reductase iron-sulfur subunit